MSGASDVGDMKGYTGYYDSQPWASEFVIVPWAGGLATIDLSTSEPADDIGLLKPLGGDRFVVLNDKGPRARHCRVRTRCQRECDGDAPLRQSQYGDTPIMMSN